MARRLRLWGWPLVLLAASGCGDGQARVHGQLLEAPGRKFTLGEGEQAIMTFFLLGSDDRPDPYRFYSALVHPDGSFDVQVSNGRIPPGKYRVALAVVPMSEAGGGRPRLVDRLDGRFTRDASSLQVELKPGANDLTLDLSALRA